MVADSIVWVMLLGGSFFVLTGSVGMIRMPDVYTRMHAAGLTDTLGVAMILIGLMVHVGIGLVAIKLVLIGIFLFFTVPTSLYALANACLSGDIKPLAVDGTLIEPESGTLDHESKGTKEDVSSIVS